MSRVAITPKDPTMVWSPRRCLRFETDLCPPIPTDFEQARVEAIMEEYGWPIEDDDTHPGQADARKREQQMAELDALYYEDFMAREEAEWDAIYAAHDDDSIIDEGGDDEASGWPEDYVDYDDLEHEAMRRDPLTNATYDGWYD